MPRSPIHKLRGQGGQIEGGKKRKEGAGESLLSMFRSSEERLNNRATIGCLGIRGRVLSLGRKELIENGGKGV